MIYDLIDIRDFDMAVSRLAKNMPWCEFDTSDPLQVTEKDDTDTK